MDMNKPSWNTIFWTIVLSIVLGAGSGVLATSLTSSYLSEYALELSELTKPLRLSEERPRSFPSSRREAIDRFAESSLQSIATFYTKGLTRPDGYKSSDTLAAGVVLTSDGWIAVPTSSPGLLSNSFMLLGREEYSVERVEYDRLHGVAFVKTLSNGLPVVTFGEALDVHVADELFLVRSNSSFKITTVEEVLHPSGESTSSDRINRRLKLADDTSSAAFAFNMSGEFVGFSLTNVLPVETILPYFSSLLKNEVFSRPSLGVNTISISDSVRLSDDKTREHLSGAYISSLESAGPAEKAGMKKSDIILSVDGQSVNSTRTLDELIYSYKKNDLVNFIIDRDGEIINIQVVLGQKIQ